MTVTYTCETTTQNTIENISFTPENSLEALSWQIATLKKAVVLSGFKHHKCVWSGFGLDINGNHTVHILLFLSSLAHIIILTSSHVVNRLHRLSRWWRWVRSQCAKLRHSGCVPLLLDMQLFPVWGPVRRSLLCLCIWGSSRSFGGGRVMLGITTHAHLSSPQLSPQVNRMPASTRPRSS